MDELQLVIRISFVIRLSTFVILNPRLVTGKTARDTGGFVVN